MGGCVSTTVTIDEQLVVFVAESVTVITMVFVPSGKGSGRVYSITIVATDGAGNTAERVLTVNVPKSQGQK